MIWPRPFRLIPALALICVALTSGCASPPASRAPALDPPPAEERRLSAEEVVAEARERDPEQAIAHLDRFPFAFELSERLEWLKAQDLPPEVFDYLDKRSRVDWEALRGDLDPDGGRDAGERSR